MGRGKLPFFENITITDVGAEGKAIARINDIVTFVNYAAPGDVVDLQVTKKRSRFMEARITNYHNLSDNREIPPCKHFGICGGCKWQHLPYPEQLKFKQKQVSDAMMRIGKMDVPVLPIIGSAEKYFYRNKLEFAFSNRRWLTPGEMANQQDTSRQDGAGFHLPGHFDKVLDIEKCWLQPDPSNDIRLEIKKFSNDHNITFFNHRNHGGMLRNLIIRTSLKGEVMVILSFYHEDLKVQNSILEYIGGRFPEITSLMYTINSKGNDTLYDQDIKVFSGKGHIIEDLDDLKFRIGPKSFFQTNTRQALCLYNVVKDFADLRGSETVYDLYTGTGTIANFLAGKAGRVIGIESVPEAIRDAETNSAINGIKNTVFLTGDLKDSLTGDLYKSYSKPQVIIADPPRAGMHKKTLEAILESAPSRIVYVSCNPASQARDLVLLSTKYKAVKAQPVDMFPQTHHVENVVLLTLN